jgi:hypothetical protein
VIVAYIDGSEIPVFVNEEVHNVNGVENGRDQDRFSDVSMVLILISNEREVTGAELVQFSDQFQIFDPLSEESEDRVGDSTFGMLTSKSTTTN